MSEKKVPEDFGAKALKVFLKIISAGEKMLKTNDLNFKKLHLNYDEILKSEGLLEYKEIKTKINRDKDYFDNDNFYSSLLYKIILIINKRDNIIFSSFYSFLYMMKSINYLKGLIEIKPNIYKDDLVKLFVFILYIFITENLKDNKFIDINEGFFKGSFNELTKKYSSIYPYKDSNVIIETLSDLKEISKSLIIKSIELTFNAIIEHINNYTKLDKFFEEMRIKAYDILYEIPNVKDNVLTEKLITLIKKFYSNEDYLLFVNFCSENFEKYDSGYSIDYNFILDKNNRAKYLVNSFDYENENNDINSLANNKENFEKYIDFKDKINERMLLFCPKIYTEWNLNNLDEIILCAAEKSDICFEVLETFKSIDKIKNNIENLEQENIFNIIKNIFDGNEFYEIFFLILKCDIVKKFFFNKIYLANANDIFSKYKESEECFKEVYEKFISEYDKKEDNYKQIKNIIILKILSKDDRAYVIKHIKRIIVNPSQFYVGKNIKENELKTILEAYLLIVILHETEHFLRLLDLQHTSVFDKTPKKKEGGRLFIKYLFGVESISHVNIQQAQQLLDIKNWKNHDKIKTIFNGQLEINESKYQLRYFPNSLSFYSTYLYNKDINVSNQFWK